ncbi:MAG: hypothetical protein GY730_10745 [bacterium]|nr:hypothetical protein [bacterium]
MSLSNNQKQFKSFMVLDLSSSRIRENDILFKGQEALDLIIKTKNICKNKDDLKSLSLINRITKLEKMMSLLNSTEDIIITKFFNVVWKRYSQISNSNEYFIDLNILQKAAPDIFKKNKDLIASRIVEKEDVDIESGIEEL